MLRRDTELSSLSTGIGLGIAFLALQATPLEVPVRAFPRAILMIPKPLWANPRAALLCGALAGFPVLAQTAPIKTFDLEQVTLSPGGQQSLLLSTGDTLAKGQLRLSLAGQYQRNPLVFLRSDVRQGAVISRRLSSHLSVAYGLTDSVELALQLPVILSQAGDDLSSQGVAPVAGTVLGAPALQGRLVLARQSSLFPGDLGLNLALALPFGSSSGFAQDPGMGLAASASAGFGRDFGSLLRVGTEVGAVMRKRESLANLAPGLIGQVGSYATLGVTATTLGEGLRGEVSGRAFVALTQSVTAGEVLAGARYPLPHGLEVFALAGPGIGQMPGTPVFRAFAGVALSPFPSEPVGRVTEEPRAAPVLSLAPVSPPVPPSDADDDGFADADDACPDQAGVLVHQGCPPPPPPTPPSAPTAPAPVEDTSPKLAELKAGRIEIKEQVQFASSKSEILAGSFPLLEQVVKILEEHPELTRLRIGGHTDSRGPRDYNVKLSRDRAESVRRFLIERGVEPSRLEAQGYGPDQPIDTNETAAGRQKNRRTEFISISE
jgi:OOP family OmpA-OmpF porin